MQRKHHTLRYLMAALLAAFAGGCASHEQESDSYPNRPIKVVVPFAAGGGSDAFARVVKRGIEENDLLPQPLVIVNVGGASGTIGSRRVLAADPDGYTVLLLHDAIVMAKYSGKVKYGPEAFEAVAGTSHNGMVMAVRAGPDGYRDLRQAIDDAELHPNAITFGCSLGTPTHFAGLLLERERPGAEFRFVQAGGGAQRFTALKGGHIDLTVFSSEEFLRYRSEGIRALATFGPQRHPAMADVPTAIEQGIHVQTGLMQYWWMPKATPLDRIALFADALEKAMQTDVVREFLGRVHSEPSFVRDDALAARIGRLDAMVSTVDMRQKVDMPNLPLWTLLASCVFGAAVLARTTRTERALTSGPARPDTTYAYRYRLAGMCMLMVIVYVLAISFGITGVSVGFRSATMVFVVGLGLSLSRNRWQALPRLVALALIMSFGLHYLFTQVLVIDLP